MMVAVDDGTGLQYLLTDHLGSTVAVTNQSGTLTSQQRYPSTSSGRRLPFGAARTIPNSPILGTDFTYTGQRKLDDGMGGVMDYKARFYSPALGRFQQPDSIIPNPANPQSMNRYAYVSGNPLRYSDPSGHMEYEEAYTETDGTCSVGDTSCNWVGKKKNKPVKESPAPILKANEGGTIYGSVWVLPSSEIRDAQLTTKAEESYTGWSGSGEMPFNPFTPNPFGIVDESVSLANDFTPPSPNYDPIFVELHWDGNGSGIYIDNIQVQNNSHTAVVILGAKFTDNPLGIQPVYMNGNSDYAGTNGDVTLNVKSTVNLPITIQVQLWSIGGYPEYPSLTIQLPDYPPGGCSLWP